MQLSLITLVEEKREWQLEQQRLLAQEVVVAEERDRAIRQRDALQHLCKSLQSKVKEQKSDGAPDESLSS